jgi:Leucine-rich repeat (LRR) protein/HEAT repeat protein
MLNRLFLCLLLLLFANLSIIAEEKIASITFKVNDVKPAAKLLAEENYKKILEQTLATKVEAYSNSSTNAKLVKSEIHPFISTLHLAFVDHRPVVISPDSIWLLIIQGFAEHINENPEEFRKLLVSHTGKKLIKVRRDNYIKGQQNPWNESIEEFCLKIKQNCDQELFSLITDKFSTTRAVDSIAFKVSLMSAVRNYFTYEMQTFCGITKITVEGTPEDWHSLIERTKKLRKYKLYWWLNELLPVLQKIEATANGKIDQEFWQSIYKRNSASGGDIISGWIIKFFPYIYHNAGAFKVRNPHLTKKPTKYNPENHSECGLQLNNFPSGLAKAPFIWLYFDKKYKMEFIAGFVGIKQNHQTKALSPEIGWAVAEHVNFEIKNIPRALKWYCRSGKRTTSFEVWNDDVKLDKSTFNIIKQMPMLESFELHRQNITDDAFHHLSGLTNLKVLKFSKTKLNGSCLKYLAKSKKIFYLNFNHTLFDNNAIKYLKDFPALNKLYLSNTKLDANADFSPLAALKKLKIVNLANNNISDKSLISLQKCSSIENFSIAYNQNLSPAAVLELVHNLKNITHLYMVGIPFNDADIARLVKICPKLQELDISDSKITSNALLALATLKNLQALGVKNINLTDKDLNKLLLFSKLNSIDLSGTLITTASKENLKNEVGIETNFYSFGYERYFNEDMEEEGKKEKDNPINDNIIKLHDAIEGNPDLSKNITAAQFSGILNNWSISPDNKLKTIRLFQKIKNDEKLAIVNKYFAKLKQDNGYKRNIAEALYRMGDRSKRDYILKIFFNKKDSDYRLIFSMARLVDFNFLVKNLKHTDPVIRRKIIDIIECKKSSNSKLKNGIPKATKQEKAKLENMLLDIVLNDKNEASCVAALSAKKQLEIKFSKNILDSEHGSELKILAISKIKFSDTDEVFNLLAKALMDTDEAIQLAAVEKIQQSTNERYVPLLIKLSSDQKSSNMAEIEETLIQLKSHDLPWLDEKLEANIARTEQLVNTIGKAKNGWSKNILLDIVANKKLDFNEIIIQSLALQKKTRIAPYILKYYFDYTVPKWKDNFNSEHDDDKENRLNNAVIFLGELDDKRATPLLLQELHKATSAPKKDIDYIESIITSLGLLKAKTAITPIGKFINNEDLGETVLDAIYSIGGKKAVKTILPQITNKAILKIAQIYLNSHKTAETK